MVDIAPGLDRFEARLVPTSTGDWTFRVEGWSDPYGTWAHDADDQGRGRRRRRAHARRGRAAARAGRRPHGRDGDADGGRAGAPRRGPRPARRPRHAPPASVSARRCPPRCRRARRAPAARRRDARRPSYPLVVDRPLALAGAWYELFPRSQGARYDPDTGAVGLRDAAHGGRATCRASPAWGSTSST